MSEQRLLFVAPALETGGAERQWAILLPALVDRGFGVTALTLARKGRFFHELHAAGVDIYCAAMRRRTDLRGLKRALSFRRLKPDLVISQSISAQVVGHWLAVSSGAPHLEIVHSPPNFSLRRHQQAIVRLYAPRVDCAVAVSSTQLPGLIGLGYEPDRIRVIPNGVPQLTPLRSRAALRSELQLSHDDFVAVLLASLTPRKRPDLFLRSVVAANKSNHRIRGLIVGDGPELSLMTDLARQTDGVVQVLGGRSDVADIFGSADVACLTSWPGVEATPMALLEAMSVGRPVVATDAGGVKNVVESGVTGLVVTADDDGREFVRGLLTLAEDPERAQELGHAGKVRYDALFSAENMVARYAETFTEVVRTAALGPHKPWYRRP